MLLKMQLPIISLIFIYKIIYFKEKKNIKKGT